MIPLGVPMVARIADVSALGAWFALGMLEALDLGCEAESYGERINF